MNQGEREITLSNGLSVRFVHRARRYFGDYHEVRLEVRCEVLITTEMFEDEAGYRDAVAKLGKSASYLRVVEQMGVPTDAVPGCVESLVENFRATTLSYFESPDFPRKLVHAELVKAKRPRRPLMPMLGNG